MSDELPQYALMLLDYRHTAWEDLPDYHRAIIEMLFDPVDRTHTRRSVTLAERAWRHRK